MKGIRQHLVTKKQGSVSPKVSAGFHRAKRFNHGMEKMSQQVTRTRRNQTKLRHVKSLLRLNWPELSIVS